jgi:hypothetical protein
VAAASCSRRAAARARRAHEARLLPGITTTTGRPLNASPLSWTFTVIGDLEVAQVEPPPNTTEVLVDARRISVRFNHPVVALTTIEAQKTLPQPLAIAPALEGSGRWIDTSTYLSPTAGLAPSTAYRVTVAAGLQDQTGGALRQPSSGPSRRSRRRWSRRRRYRGRPAGQPARADPVFFNQPWTRPACARRSPCVMPTAAR